MPRPTVLVTESLAPAALARLEAACTVRRIAAHDPGFRVALRDADGLVVRTYTRVDAALLAEAPNLRVVARAGVGVDNIDLDACAARGVAVVHTPAASTQAVAEYVLMLAGDALRPRPQLEGPLDAKAWAAVRAATCAEREIAECTWGVIGLGRIGSRVARILAGYGARVLYHDLLAIDPTARHGAVPAPLERVHAEAHVLTLHVDGRPSNRHLVDATVLARLRPDVVLINACRGSVVDPVALAAFLRAHPRARAMLDVHEPEPVPPGHPLLDLPNCTLLPHLASRTASAMARMSDVVDEVVEVLRRE